MRPKYRLWMDIAREIITAYSKDLCFHKIFIMLFIHISFYLQLHSTSKLYISFMKAEMSSL